MRLVGSGLARHGLRLRFRLRPGPPDPAASPAVRAAAVSAGSLHPSVQGSGCLGRARSSRRRHPSPAGKAGTRPWEAGRGGGEARRSPRPAGRGRRAVSLARGPGLPGGPGRGRRRGWWPGPDTRNAHGTAFAEEGPGRMRTKSRRVLAWTGALSLPWAQFPTWHVRGRARPTFSPGLVGVSQGPAR